MADENNDAKQGQLETNFGLVGGELSLDGQSQSLDNLRAPVYGAGFDKESEDGKIKAEAYVGLDFDGDAKIGVRGEYNLMEEAPKQENGFGYKIDAVGDLMYATRAGGFVTSLALQAEASLLEGHLKGKVLAGYVDAPSREESGFYSQVRADIDFSKDECTGFMKKGCLTNIAQATFPPEGGYEFRNEFLHDVVYQGHKLNLRVGPSLEVNSQDSNVTPGIAVRVDFDL
jgi:hypothetical protein|tara:strand:- start:53609 stop:54295 length:687 start_codon:yes stop_codon:yes gene_type:complete